MQKDDNTTSDWERRKFERKYNIIAIKKLPEIIEILIMYDRHHSSSYSHFIQKGA